MDIKPRPWLAMGTIFVSQVLISFVPAIAPVMAPDMAPRLGVSADSVGIFSALTYVSAIGGGLVVAPWIPWLGPVRSMQIMLLVTVIAASLAAFNTLLGVILSALVLGVSLGIPHPAFTAILGRHTPSGSMGLFLSLRFAAAPIGIALAALVVPATTASIGERGTIVAAAVACAIAALAVGRTVAALDWRYGKRPPSVDLTSAVRMVLEHPALRRLAFVCMIFAMVQQGFQAYAVLLLVGLGLPLKTSAGLLAMSQFVAVIGRIAIGHASDRWVRPRAMLAVYGLAMSGAFMAVSALPHAPSQVQAGAVMSMIAVTAMGWPGLMTSELLRLVPLARIAQCSSGNQVFTFGGAVIGPFMLATVLEQGVGYAVAFVGLGGLAFVAGVLMLAPTHARLKNSTNRETSIE